MLNLTHCADVLEVRRWVIAARDEDAILVAERGKGHFWTKWLYSSGFALVLPSALNRGSLVTVVQTGRED